MNRKIFRELTSIEEARRRLYDHYIPSPVCIEVIPLSKSYGRVLADDVEAQIDVPHFDRATMDGFAVHAEDTFGAEEDKPVLLGVVDKIGAGEQPKTEVERGQAIEISTGAPMPKGANAVIMVEYTWLKGSCLKIFRPVTPGENIMAAGSDIMAGELVLRKGSILTPRDTGVLASLGLVEVKVYKMPKIAVLSTGNELVSPGTPLDYGKIYDINAYSISDAVSESGGEPIFLGVVGDNPKALRLGIKKGLRIADMVVVSGGTSAGVGDLLYRIINRLGNPGILVHGISVKPGKPLIIAVVDGKPLFGLPGYPVSALITFDLFIQPVVRRMAGLKPDVERKTIHAKTAQKVYSQEGRRVYSPVSVVQNEYGENIVYPVPGGSGAITTLVKADGFIEIPENKTFLEEGEMVQVELFSPELKPVDLMIIGSHCIGIDLLLKLINKNHLGVNYRVINVGSSGGLAAIRRGEADIAGIHLIDEETGKYNMPFLYKYGLTDRVVLVKGYSRQQGLIVAEGNPKNIRGFEDVLRDDLFFINRNLGSGTRILFELNLEKVAQTTAHDLKEIASKVNGYDIEAKSHTSVAVAVLQGKADLGLGIRPAAEKYGLDFIPIANEEYDFAIRSERYWKKSIQVLLKVLRSEEFREELEKLPGLTPTKETGKVIYSPDNTPLS